MNVKILVCAHKQVTVPTDSAFLPIHVGKAISNVDLGLTTDNTGDNISEKNGGFCELTALYWAWKNMEPTEYVGLCHYRRFFNFKPMLKKKNKVLDFDAATFEEQIKVDTSLKGFDVILPKRGKSMTSMRFNYCYHHVKEDFEIMEQVVSELYPDYADTFKRVADKERRFSMANMFIARYDIFQDYCSWLFTIMFEVEKRIKLSPYPYQQRAIGFMGERLLNVYFYHHRYKTLFRPIIFYNGL